MDEYHEEAGFLERTRLKSSGRRLSSSGGCPRPEGRGREDGGTCESQVWCSTNTVHRGKRPASRSRISASAAPEAAAAKTIREFIGSDNIFTNNFNGIEDCSKYQEMIILVSRF